MISRIKWDLVVHSPDRKQQSLAAYVLQLTGIFLWSSGFHMAVLHRIGHCLYTHHLGIVSLFIDKFIYHWYHCVVPSSADIGPGVWFPHPLGIVIAKRAQIGRCVRIFQDTQMLGYERPVKVGDCVRLNAGCIVVGSSIAGRVIVAPGAVVTKNIPSDSVVKGVPAVCSPLVAHHHKLVWDIMSKSPWHKWDNDVKD